MTNPTTTTYLPGIPGGTEGLEACFEFQDIVLNDRRHHDRYRIQKIEGLYDADFRDLRQTNPQAHGETAFRAWFGGRSVTFDGFIEAGNINRMRNMSNQLTNSVVDLLEAPLYLRSNGPGWMDKFLVDRLFESNTFQSLTTSGNEITDLSRSVGTSGDGLAADTGTYGIWRAQTNLLANGGMETNTTGWSNAASGTTLTRDTGSDKFGSASLKVVTDGTAANQGATSDTATGQALAAGNIATVSCWMKGNSGGETILLSVVIFNTDASSTIGIDITCNLTTSFQRFSAQLPVALGKTGDKFRIRARTNGNVALTFFLDGAQIETQSQATGHTTPYIETNGSTATRAAARVQGNIAAYPGDQNGWVAARVRPGWDSDKATLASGDNPTVFDMEIDASNKISLLFVASLQNWRAWRAGTGGGTATLDTAASFSANAAHTVIMTWDPNFIYLSVDGGNFTSIANSKTLVGSLPSTYNIGSRNNNGQFNGEFFWFAMGRGTLSNADAAALHASGNSGPGILTSCPKSPTVLWNAASAMIEGAYEVGTAEITATGRRLQGSTTTNEYQVIKQSRGSAHVQQQTIVEFVTGQTAPGANGHVTAIAKWTSSEISPSLGNEDWIGARAINNALQIVSSLEGVETIQTTTAITLAANTRYWLRCTAYDRADVEGGAAGKIVYAEIATFELTDDIPVGGRSAQTPTATISAAFTSGTLYDRVVNYPGYGGVKWQQYHSDDFIRQVTVLPLESGDLTIKARKSAPIGLTESQDTRNPSRPFFLPFRCSDPRWQSTIQRKRSIAGARTTVLNDGGFESNPIIRLTGPQLLPRVSNFLSGLTLALDASILSSDYYEIDILNRTIKDKAGTNRISKLKSGSDWITLLPGSQDLGWGRANATSGAEKCEIFWRNSRI